MAAIFLGINVYSGTYCMDGNGSLHSCQSVAAVTSFNWVSMLLLTNW